ncbi:hypothetical protein [Bradyrhizobium sp. SYSU BS000235]|uniref:hypothetical protein n=1 Tax=Bradyrhizobium sp. SYSU BS000235 TaxID=3411332 RepID=UPI003C767E02
MLEFCLLTLAGLILICGAQVEQLEERQRQELAASADEMAPQARWWLARNLLR